MLNGSSSHKKRRLLFPVGKPKIRPPTVSKPLGVLILSADPIEKKIGTVNYVG